MVQILFLQPSKRKTNVLESLIANTDFIDQLIALNLVSDYYEDSFGNGWLSRNGPFGIPILVSPEDSVWKRYVIINGYNRFVERVLIFKNDNIAFTSTTYLDTTPHLAFDWEKSKSARTIWIKKAKYIKDKLSISSIFSLKKCDQNIQVQQSFLFLMRNFDIIKEDRLIDLSDIEGII